MKEHPGLGSVGVHSAQGAKEGAAQTCTHRPPHCPGWWGFGRIFLLEIVGFFNSEQRLLKQNVKK